MTFFRHYLKKKKNSFSSCQFLIVLFKKIRQLLKQELFRNPENLFHHVPITQHRIMPNCCSYKYECNIWISVHSCEPDCMCCLKWSYTLFKIRCNYKNCSSLKVQNYILYNWIYSELDQLPMAVSRFLVLLLCAVETVMKLCVMEIDKKIPHLGLCP